MKIPSGLTFGSNLNTNFSVSDLQGDYLTIENNTKFQADDIISLDINPDTYEPKSISHNAETQNFIPPTLEDIDNEIWEKRKRSDKETPPQFIARVYEKWLGEGLLRSHLKIDEKLYQALSNWLRRNEMPAFLYLPNERNSYKDFDITEEDLRAFKKVQAYRVQQSRKNK